jgi:hypothetical protein
VLLFPENLQKKKSNDLKKKTLAGLLGAKTCRGNARDWLTRVDQVRYNARDWLA